MKKYITSLILSILIILTIGCEHRKGEDAVGYITFSLRWSGVSDYKGPKAVNSRPRLALPRNVLTFWITISAPDMKDDDRYFRDLNPEGGSIIIDGVKPGNNRKVIVRGLNLNEDVIYKGFISNITVKPGKTANAGTITLHLLPTVPVDVIAIPADGQVTLKWNIEMEVSGFKVYYGRQPGGPYDGSDAEEGASPIETSNNNIVLTGLSNDITYYFSISAFVEVEDTIIEEGLQSEEISITPALAIAPPDPPENIEVTVEDGKINLLWDPAEGATGYRVYFDKVAGVPYNGEGSPIEVDDISVSLSNCENGKPYYFAIRSFNNAGEGPYSKEFMTITGYSSIEEVKFKGNPPDEREFHSMIHDKVNKRIIIFGGSGPQGIEYYNDIWEFNPETETWQEIKTDGDMPAPRSLHTAIYDSYNLKMVVFGGMSEDGYLNDLWAFNLKKGVESWELLSSTKPSGYEPQNSEPPPLAAHSAVYDPINKRMVVFGGSYEGNVNDILYAFDLQERKWIQPGSRNNNPQGRYGHSACCFDNSMFIFGGRNEDGDLNDTYKYDFTKEQWEEVNSNTSPPGERAFAATACNQDYNSMLIIGGEWAPARTAGNYSPGRALIPRLTPSGSDLIQAEGHYMGDAWVYNLSRNVWEKILEVSKKEDSQEDVSKNQIATAGSTAIYDDSGRVLLFGGGDEWGVNNSITEITLPTVNDTTPPLQSNWDPSNASVIAYKSHIITLDLDEYGDCRWSISDQAYSDMPGDCTGDGSASVICPVTGLSEGANTIYIACNDTLSNSDTLKTNTDLIYTVDTIPPDTSIISKPFTPTNFITASFEFTCSETNCTYECQIDSGGFNVCLSPITYDLSPSDGPHTFEVRAADVVGNIDATAASYTWEIDLDPPKNPSVFINGIDAEYTNVSSVTLMLSAEEAAWVMISEDPLFIDASWEPYTDSRSFSLSTGDGTKTVYVRYLDTAGNETPVISAGIMLDTVAPGFPAGITTNAGDSYVSIDWDDNIDFDLAGYNIYCSTNSGAGYTRINPSLITTSYYAAAELENGTTYYFVLTAIDFAGNESEGSIEVSATPLPKSAERYRLVSGGIVDFGGMAVSSDKFMKSSGKIFKNAVVEGDKYRIILK